MERKYALTTKIYIEIPLYLRKSCSCKGILKEHLSLVSSLISALLIFDARSCAHQKNTRLTLLWGKAEQNRSGGSCGSFALIFFPFPKSDDSVSRMCFSGLFGSHNPLRTASLASQRKSCIKRLLQ